MHDQKNPAGKPARELHYLLVAITIIVFLPSLFNDFQQSWDDQWMLLEQPFIINFSWEGLWYHFFNFYHSQYSPVNTVFYLIIYSFAGFNAGIFHAACLLVHAANVLMVYLLVQKILNNLKPGWETNRRKLFAGITALIFAIHPLQVESVAWISASKIVLYAFFTLLGLLLYLKYINQMRWYLNIFIYPITF